MSGDLFTLLSGKLRDYFSRQNRSVEYSSLRRLPIDRLPVDLEPVCVSLNGPLPSHLITKIDVHSRLPRLYAAYSGIDFRRAGTPYDRRSTINRRSLRAFGIRTSRSIAQRYTNHHCQPGCLVQDLSEKSWTAGESGAGHCQYHASGDQSPGNQTFSNWERTTAAVPLLQRVFEPGPSCGSTSARVRQIGDAGRIHRCRLP